MSWTAGKYLEQGYNLKELQILLRNGLLSFRFLPLLLAALPRNSLPRIGPWIGTIDIDLPPQKLDSTLGQS